MTNFRKNVLSFEQTPGAEDVCKERICACMVLYVRFSSIWYNATWPLSVENVLSSDPVRGLKTCAWTEYMLSLCAMFHSLKLDMHHDYFRKKKCLCLLISPQGPCSIPFNLICNITAFRKKNVLTFGHTQGLRVYVRTEYMVAFCFINHSLPRPLSLPREPGLGLQSKFPFHIYCTSGSMQNFSKSIDNWMSYCEI